MTTEPTPTNIEGTTSDLQSETNPYNEYPYRLVHPRNLSAGDELYDANGTPYDTVVEVSIDIDGTWLDTWHTSGYVSPTGLYRIYDPE